MVLHLLYTLGWVLFIVTALVAVWEIQMLREMIKELKKAIDMLRLQSRARISEVSFTDDKGQQKSETTLVRLGRAASTRRVVVGGDDRSELNRKLGTDTEADNGHRNG